MPTTMDYRARAVLAALPDGARPAIEDLLPLIRQERDLFFAAATADLPPLPAFPSRETSKGYPNSVRIGNLETALRLQNAVIDEQNRRIRIMVEHFTGVYALVDMVALVVPGREVIREVAEEQVQSHEGRFQKVMDDATAVVVATSERTQALIGWENRRTYMRTRWERVVGIGHRWLQRLWWG